MKKYDVVVAGAGIAGCLAARNLSRSGLRVLLLERRSRDTLGHDWWDSVEKSVFDEVELAQPTAPEGLSYSGATTVCIQPGTAHAEFLPPPDKIHVDRKLLAARLLEEAQNAGAEIRTRTSVTAPITAKRTITGVTVKSKNEIEESIHAPLTIDATGIAATIRKKIPRTQGIPREIAASDIFKMHREIRSAPGRECHKLLRLGSAGISWYDTTHEGQADFLGGTFHSSRMVPARRIVKEMVAEAKLENEEVLRGGYTAALPLRRCLDTFVMPGLMLVGDSACQCNPIDGSGIASSFRAARIAAKTAAAALNNGGPTTAALWPYVAEYKKTQGVKFAIYDYFKKSIFAADTSNISYLFENNIIIPEIFWLISGNINPQHVMQQVTNLTRLINHPRLINDLSTTAAGAAKINRHYKSFPDTYNKKAFSDWQFESSR